MCVINVTETTITTGSELPFVSTFCELLFLLFFKMRKLRLHWFYWAVIISFPNSATVSQCAIRCLIAHQLNLLKWWRCRVFLLLWRENGFYQRNKHNGRHKLLLSVPWNSCRFACQHVCVETENWKRLCYTIFTFLILNLPCNCLTAVYWEL